MGDKGFAIFPKRVSSKGKVIGQVEVELTSALYPLCHVDSVISSRRYLSPSLSLSSLSLSLSLSVYI